MITLEILDYQCNKIAQWNWEISPIPNKGDTLLIHFGNNNDNEYRINVLRREFDGNRTNVVRIVTDYVKISNEDVEH